MGYAANLLPTLSTPPNTLNHYEASDLVSGHHGPLPTPTSAAAQKQQLPAIIIQVDHPHCSTILGRPRFRNNPATGDKVAVIPNALPTPKGLMLSAVSE